MSIIAEKIIKANNKLVAAITSFNSEIGPLNGNDLGELYETYELSSPPTESEFNLMPTKDRISYRKAERKFELRVVEMNDIHDELIAIDSGSGAFGTIAAVKTWAKTNMGEVGADVASNLTAWIAIRAKLKVFIEPSMLASHAVAVKEITTEINFQVDNKDGNIKT